MTMIEMLFVMIIIGTVTTIVTPRLAGLLVKGREAGALGELKSIHTEILNYVVEHDSYPPSLAVIGMGGVRDPWGQPYVYEDFGGAIPGHARLDQFSVPLNTEFDLYSVGEDGATSQSILGPAGQDDILIGDDGGFIGRGTRY